MTRKEQENYISYSIPLYPKVQPIYDWTTEDVWTAAHVFDWDYNRAYDRMEMAGVSHAQQRCAPAFGEQPLNGLWMWAECFPEMWHAMEERVPGVGSAVRYARTELYGNYGRIEKPPGMAWGEFIMHWVDKYPPDVQAQVIRRIRQVIGRHQRKAGNDPILPTAAHPHSWISWRFIAGLAVVADLKERRQEAEGSVEDYEAELAALRARGPEYFKEMTRW